MGETFCVSYVLYVYNTRLESTFIEKHSVLLDKTPGEIFPTESFPDFPKFLLRKFSRREIPYFVTVSVKKFSPQRNNVIILCTPFLEIFVV